MAFISELTANNLRDKVTSNETELKSLYRIKSIPHYRTSVDHGLVEEYQKNGWEVDGTPLKTKTRMRKEKPHDVLFEDEVWCQFYDLGYRTLNIDRNFKLPFGKNDTETKQIDIIAINDESIIIVECKSRKTKTSSSSFKTEFESLGSMINGFSKSLEQIFGKERKIKHIFATRNIRIDNESSDGIRLTNLGSFLYNDNTFEYVKGLIKSYKGAAHYQFLALIFKGRDISKKRIEIPAIEGKMGKKKYYMFSIEPHLLLKLGFVLHRTKANNTELPTYQRLLVPSRLKGIGAFIDNEGYFPNSVVLNFDTKSKKFEFQSNQKLSSSNSRTGILKIPNAYAIAYIIDGQHRIYGYANSKHKHTNTIPAVAFTDLTPKEQLEIFMSINENQKAVSATLRITLEEDLFWDAERLDSRLKALRSSIIRVLTTSVSSPLYDIISIGEDKAKLSSRPFARVLPKSGILPIARGNKVDEDDRGSSLYNLNNLDHQDEMERSRKRIVKFISLAYDSIEKSLAKDLYDEFILSNRGTFAYLGLIGSLSQYIASNGEVKPQTPAQTRFNHIEKFIDELVFRLSNLPESESEVLLQKQGQGADTLWLRTFQSFMNNKFKDYSPEELIDWRQRQDQELQDEGRKLGTEIEKYLKKSIIRKLQVIFGDDWELEIGSIQRQCEQRAAEQREKIYKEKLTKKEIKWTEQFFITDYKSIIESYFTKTPENPPEGFKNFEAEFAIDIGDKFNSKKDKTKWLLIFNSLRNNWAHEGTKEKGLNLEEVKFLRNIHKTLYSG